MDLVSRIKKEMTEGIVRALLEDAEYRVIDVGIEKVVREVSCMTALEYRALAYPAAMTRCPDFVVMDRRQTRKHLVEVKYRRQWDVSVLAEMREQVETFGDITLVYVNGEGAEDVHNFKSPALHLQCCRLRFKNEVYEAELRRKDKSGKSSLGWESVDKITPGNTPWWALSPMKDQFEQLSGDAYPAYQSLNLAIEAMRGILGPSAGPA